MAMIKTMKGEKSNLHIKAINMKPNYNIDTKQPTEKVSGHL